MFTYISTWLDNYVRQIVEETINLSKQAEREHEQCQILCKRLSKNAKLPTRGTDNSAGLDLYSAVDISILPHERGFVPLDLKLIIPQGCYGRMASRSGLCNKKGIDIKAGVIDADYRGNLNVILKNDSEDPFEITQGMRIAQLICEKIEYPEIIEVNEVNETERGEKGFGSTGYF